MRLSIAEFRADMADPLNRVAYNGARIELHRRGKVVAAVVSVEDLERLRELEDHSDRKAAAKARKEKGAIPLEQIKAELEMKGK